MGGAAKRPDRGHDRPRQVSHWSAPFATRPVNLLAKLLALGGRTRTPNDRARTCSVADYTTPEWADPYASRLSAGARNARW